MVSQLEPPISNSNNKNRSIQIEVALEFTDKFKALTGSSVFEVYYKGFSGLFLSKISDALIGIS